MLFNKMDLPKPMKYGKGKVISTAQDMLEDLAQHHRGAGAGAGASAAAEAEGDVPRCAAGAGGCEGRIHTTFNQVGTATGRLSFDESEPAEHSDSHGGWAGDSRGVHCGARGMC